MNELVFFLEEPSAAALLEGLLPRLLPPNFTCRMIVFEGKQDLEKRLVKRLRGYLNPKARFVVLRDKDSADCREIKTNLRQKADEAGRPDTLIRIACYELESWYLADLAAVEAGLQIAGLTGRQNKRLFRNPDVIPNPAHELQRIAPSYQKLSGSRAIGPYLDPENMRSDSFRVFISGIRRLCSDDFEP
ncbi:uncharacterized protein DUF4276 [Hydrogenispora ethanolica]|uniref:Uncharacterized protein DUF4276 n=1 Tax=Hydrogenispora ethanolica TaxID=1082276 RepID=A0A4R1SDQ6_HYDET|nr:DUF4276 family protein [Hydrogenispora ethanolica]TCL76782.1 uncharacterized protein DUF4276 [Hydrogenispora ethanolica]